MLVNSYLGVQDTPLLVCVSECACLCMSLCLSVCDFSDCSCPVQG